MEQLPKKDHRHSIRLKGYDYSQAGGYYITIVTSHRENLFGEMAEGEMKASGIGRIVQDCWDEIPVHFPNLDVDVFVLMPNHIHGIIFIHEKEKVSADVGRGTIYRAPAFANRASTLAIHSPILGLRAPEIVHRDLASTMDKFGQPTVGSLSTIVRTFKAAVTRRAGIELSSGNIWQRNYYEHVLRDQVDYERIAGYILDNPINWENDEENNQISVEDAAK